MTIELSPEECRVIACLIEKEITTPDQYPLSLNALTNACNQRSNRDPVVNFDEQTVQQIVDGLIKKHHISEQSGFGSRVSKFQHRFCNTNYGALKFSAQELAVLCELLLRGPQTPGELRSRASRLCALSDVSEVDAVLAALNKREDGPFVVRLTLEPGRRESRYAHLFSGEPEANQLHPAQHATPATMGSPALEDRLSELEQRVLALESALAALGKIGADSATP
jgi:uncharacterized protein YceH (UPF0502 family)